MMLYIIALRLVNGNYELLAWTDRNMSVKHLRRITKQFEKDADVVEPCLMEWDRFFPDKREVKRELTKYDGD